MEKAYIAGFVKRAQEQGLTPQQSEQLFKLAHIYSPKGIGYNTDTEIKGLPTPTDEEREKMKLSPALAALLAGPIGSALYGGYKDVKNQKFTGINRMGEIDPGKFSWDRGNFYSDRSASQHISNQVVRTIPAGLGIGALLGAGAGVGENLAAHNNPLDLSNLGPDLALGSAAGVLGGIHYGSYRGAKNYNERVVDKL